MKKLKKIPKFKNEDEEREFWASHETTDYFDIKKSVSLDLSSLKRTTRPITVRLPEALVNKLKILANKKDIPYQSLLKIFLDEKVKEEIRVSF
ncbi:BrnA antitoxin family protein [Candidatus Gottesmanbacteria bacterium]|nr:BrnA antitoxin family protein [Candidatus Gottesmanbacteria bacterium]